MLSSPFTDVLTIAWHTYPAGTVGVFHDDSYIGYSYGINSPDIDWVGNAYDVNPYGDVDYGNYLGSSYGSPGTDYGDQAWIVRSDGVVFHGNDYVGRSYGINSPDREVDNCSCIINSSGEAYWSYFATVVLYSYGSPGMLFRSIAFQTYPDGDVDYTFSNNIDLSYGK